MTIGSFIFSIFAIPALILFIKLKQKQIAEIIIASKPFIDSLWNFKIFEFINLQQFFLVLTIPLFFKKKRYEIQKHNILPRSLLILTTLSLFIALQQSSDRALAIRIFLAIISSYTTGFIAYSTNSINKKTSITFIFFTLFISFFGVIEYYFNLGIFKGFNAFDGHIIYEDGLKKLTAPYSHFHDFARYLLISILFSLVFIENSTKKILTISILFCVLYLTFSRTTTVGAVISTILFFYFSNENKLSKFILPTAIIGSIGLAYNFLKDTSFENYIAAFSFITESDTANFSSFASGRGGYWLFHLDYFSKNSLIMKLFGNGLGFSTDVGMLYFPDQPIYWTAHSEFLRILTEQGAVALAIFIFLSIKTCIKCLRLYKINNNKLALLGFIYVISFLLMCVIKDALCQSVTSILFFFFVSYSGHMDKKIRLTINPNHTALKN